MTDIPVAPPETGPAGRISLSIPDRELSLRSRRGDDLPFLRQLFISTRWEEVTGAGMDRMSATLFLDGQFTLQCRHYDTHYLLDGERLIVEVEGQPVGRLELWRDAARRVIRVVDISLLPPWRGRGIGRTLLTAVQAVAAAEGRNVRLQVDKFNPAHHLYLSLGFQPVDDRGTAWEMEWRPPRPGRGSRQGPRRQDTLRQDTRRQGVKPKRQR